MTPIPTIGRCIGCDAVHRLDDGVCRECLAPPRGRVWARMSHRVRTNPAYAFAVYRAIQSDFGRRIFVRVYGLPTGAVRTCADA